MAGQHLQFELPVFYHLFPFWFFVGRPFPFFPTNPIGGGKQRAQTAGSLQRACLTSPFVAPQRLSAPQKLPFQSDNLLCYKCGQRLLGTFCTALGLARQARGNKTDSLIHSNA
jgi:hypothetical protein